MISDISATHCQDRLFLGNVWTFYYQVEMVYKCLELVTVSKSPFEEEKVVGTQGISEGLSENQ